MSSAVTTATITAVTSNVPSLAAAVGAGVAALVLLLVFLLEKEVLLSSARPDVLAATRYLNVVIVPLLLACGLIAIFRLGIAFGLVH